MDCHNIVRNTFRWTTSEGHCLLLKDMKDSHVINCIFWAAAAPNSYSPSKLDAFINEANYRGLKWSAPIDPKKEKIKMIRDKVNSVALETLPISALESILNRLP